MPTDDIANLRGRTTERVSVFSDSVVIEFTDGSQVEIIERDGAMRLIHRRPPVEGSTTAGTSVVIGDEPNPRLG